MIMIMTIFFIVIAIVIVIVIVTVIVIVIVVVIVIVLMGLFNNQANSSQPDGVDLDGPYPKEDAMFQIPIHV